MSGFGRIWCAGAAAIVLLLPMPAPQALCATASKPQAGSALDYYRVERWGVQDDLPSTAVQSLAWTPGGHLMLGLHGDAMRFDGVSFTSLGLSPLVAERTQVRAITIDREGGLWLATLNRGLFRRVAGRLIRVGVAEGLEATNIADLCQGIDGTLWIGTTQGLWAAQGASFRKVDKDAVSRLACDADGSVWVAPGDRPLWRLQNGRRSPFLVEQALAADAAYSVLSAAKTGVWVGTNQGALVHIVGDKVERFGVQHGVPASRITALAEDAHGRIWFGTWGAGAGLREGPQSFATIDVTQGLAGNTVTALAADDLGTMWVGTSSGLSRLTPRPFRIVDHRHGLPSDFTTALLQSPDGELWVGTEDGSLARGQPSGGFRAEPNEVTHPAATVPKPTLALAVDEAGSLLIGSGSQLWRWTPQGPLVLVPGLGNDAAGALAVWGVTPGASGTLWLNLGGRIGRLHEGQLRPADPKRELDLIASTPLKAKDGRVLVGAGGRIYRLENDRLVPELRLPVSAEALVYVLLETSLGLWAGTREGLVYVRGSQAEKVGVFAGLTGAVTALVADAQGDVWAASRAGLFRVRFVKDDWQVRKWNAAWGLQSTEFSFPASPSAYRMHNGELWFATNAGVVVVDPHRVSPTLPPPAATLGALMVDGVAWPLAPQVTLPVGTLRLDVEFSALRTLEPRLCQFRYRLQGIDDAWVMAARSRSARFTNLAPGTYNFAVQAAAADGMWGPTTRMQLTLPPRWYQRLLVQAVALVFVLATLTTAASLLRERRLQRRFEAVADERQRIARDLHDALEQGLTGIALHLKAIEQRTQTTDLGRPHVEAARAIVSHIRSDTRHFIWDLRREPAEGLLGALQAAAAFYRALEVGACTVSVSGPVPQVPAQTLTAVLRIVQESLTNAAKHAAAEHVQIDLHGQPDGGFTLCLADNGCGFDMNTQGRGRLGMQGMHERARRVGAQLKVHTSPGQGTKIVVSVPAKGIIRS